LTFVPVDLARDGLDHALAAAGHDPGEPTTWLWEGVIPYLTRHDVDATVAALAARSAAGTVLAVNYQSPSWIATLGRRVTGLAARLSKAPDPLAGEPWRSLWTPERMRELLARHGFAVRSDEDLLTVAARIGSPTTNRRSIGNGRVAVAAT
jgi:methyltransferase (TIGR00027 family)